MLREMPLTRAAGLSCLLARFNRRAYGMAFSFSLRGNACRTGSSACGKGFSWGSRRRLIFVAPDRLASWAMLRGWPLTRAAGLSCWLARFNRRAYWMAFSFSSRGNACRTDSSSGGRDVSWGSRRRLVSVAPDRLASWAMLRGWPLTRAAGLSCLLARFNRRAYGADCSYSLRGNACRTGSSSGGKGFSWGSSRRWPAVDPDRLTSWGMLRGWPLTRAPG